MLLLNIVFSLCIVGGVTSYNITLNQLPSDISQQLKDMIRSNLDLPVKCMRRRFKSETELLLYNRENVANPIQIDIADAKELNNNKDIIILIPGWLSTRNSEDILKLKNAYLERYDSNVLIVDWSKHAMQVYQVSYCHVPNIAQLIAKALCYWNKKMDTDLSKVHIVGHGMGAHMGGLVGKYVLPKCKAQLGRITGLDPASHIFSSSTNKLKISKSDATFVDIIHTDGELFGISSNSGHSDFYPNCGQLQPGCVEIGSIVSDSLLSDVMCNQLRSLEYMTESVTSRNAIGVSCALCPRFCRANTITEIYSVMGEEATLPSHHESYVLATNSAPPYFMGWHTYGQISL